MAGLRDWCKKIVVGCGIKKTMLDPRHLVLPFLGRRRLITSKVKWFTTRRRRQCCWNAIYRWHGAVSHDASQTKVCYYHQHLTRLLHKVKQRQQTKKKSFFLKAMVSSTAELNWYTTNETNISNKAENLLKISTSWKPSSWRRRSWIRKHGTHIHLVRSFSKVSNNRANGFHVFDLDFCLRTTFPTLDNLSPGSNVALSSCQTQSMNRVRHLARL